MSSSVIMQTFIAISLPTVTAQLGGMYLYSWVFGGYMLASTVTIPLFGKLADLLGRRVLYIYGLIVFAVGLFLAGFSQTMLMLVIFRIIMGIGAGAISPAAYAVVGDLFPDDKLTKIFGMLGIAQVISFLLGPSLGGLITDSLSWRIGFILFVPLEIMAGIFVWLGVPGSAPNKTIDLTHGLGWKEIIKKLDWQGSLLIAVGLFSFLLVFQLVGGRHYGQGSAFILISCMSIALFFFWERKHIAPVLPLKLLRQSQFDMTMLTTFLWGVLNNAAIAYIPLYYQRIRSASATQTGILLVPLMITAGIASGLCGRITFQRQRGVAAVAWLFAGVAFLGLVFLGWHWQNYLTMLFFIPVGFCVGLLLPFYLSSAQRLSDVSNRASMGGLIQLSRNLGGAMGVSLLGIWISGNLKMGMALQAIFLSLSFVAFLGLILTWLQKN